MICLIDNWQTRECPTCSCYLKGKSRTLYTVVMYLEPYLNVTYFATLRCAIHPVSIQNSIPGEKMIAECLNLFLLRFLSDLRPIPVWYLQMSSVIRGRHLLAWYSNIGYQAPKNGQTSFIARKYAILKKERWGWT